MHEAYAHALLETIKRGTSAEVAVENLHKALVAQGRVGLAHKIALALERIISKNETRRATLTVASEKHTHHAHTASGAPKDVKTIIDETLIGGWTYTNGDTHTDASFKRSLLNIYYKVTK